MFANKTLHRLLDKILPQVSTDRLELARIVFFLSFFYFATLGNYANYSKPPMELWNSQSFYKLFGLIFDFAIPSYRTLTNLTIVWHASILMAALGFFTKSSTIVSFVLSLFILGIVSGFTPSDFHHQLIVLVNGVFCFAKVGRKYSLDSYIKRTLNLNRDQDRMSLFENRWPIFLIKFLLCTMYFKAGISKLRISGMAWAFENHMLFNLNYAKPSFTKNIPKWADAFYLYFISNESLTQFSVWGVLLLEITSILPLFFLRLFPIYVFFWIIFHILVYLLMGIWASVWLIPIYLAIIPWDLIIHRLRRASGLEKSF